MMIEAFMWFGLGFLSGIIGGICVYAGFFPKPYLPEDLLYCGWIPAKQEDKGRLRMLGVLGPMKYSDQKTHYGNGCFSHCDVTWETLQKLIDWGLPNPGSFTAIDGNGQQVHRRFQYAYDLPRKATI